MVFSELFFVRVNNNLERRAKFSDLLWKGFEDIKIENLHEKTSIVPVSSKKKGNYNQNKKDFINILL